MNYSEDDYLLLSGIQHYAFCRRQWALIHIEGLWCENALTAACGFWSPPARGRGLKSR